MTDDKRDEVADALRARQSLENDAHGDVDVTSLGTSGLRFTGSDDPEDAAEAALDEDDVEKE